MDAAALIQQCTPSHVSPKAMAAIIRVESGSRPHAIGYQVVRRSDGAKFTLVSTPRNVEEAKGMARWFIQHGYKFDAGITQVNSVNFERFGLTPENMFDACTNIRTGGQIFHECLERASKRFKDSEAAYGAALSCYQSGNFTTGYSTGYVMNVRAAGGMVGQYVPKLSRSIRAASTRTPGTAGIGFIPVDPRQSLHGDGNTVATSD